MNERQLKVCAIALFADGWCHDQIAAAFDVDRERATELINGGADELRLGTMGYMNNCPAGEGMVVTKRDSEGQILKTTKLR